MIDKRLFLTVLIIVLFIFVSFGVYGGTITTIYNFSGITNPSSTHIAYNSSLISNLPWNRVKNLTYSEFTNGCYSNISNNDNKNCTTKAIGSPTGTKPIQFFNFTINTPTAFSDIQQLNISWKGEGVLKQPTPLPSATIYFWNWTKNNWSIMGGSAILGYKQVNRSFTTNINNIINQSNYDVWVLVQGNTSSILYNSQITTDYIELKVNSQTLPNTTLDGTTITLCGKVGNYSSINMKNGAIINVCEYDGTVNTGILTLENLTSFYMCPTCKINADYTGYRGTTTTGEGKGGGIKATTCGFGGGGGGYGAAGGNGDQGAGGSAYGNSTNVTSMGSAGGGNSCNSDKGGDGGGYVKINVSSTSTIDGIITSNGENGGFEYAGGAAGGGLWLITSTLQGSGTIRANGGAYGGNYGGGGGGGRIYIQYTTDSSTITYSSYGGNGYIDGGSGTIRRNNQLTLSNNNNNLPAITLINGGNFTNITISAGSNVNFTATTTIREKLTISNGNYNVSLSKNALLKTGLLLLNDTFFDYGTRLNITKNFTIGSTGTFTQVNTNNVLVNDTTTIYGTYTHKDATSSSTIKGHVKLITTNFNLKSGGFVNVDYKVYLGTTTANGEGKGGGIKATTCGFGGGGGGYGAAGGNGDQGAGGSAYGNSTNVTSMGSAGGGNSCNSDKGGDGGGYVKINVSSTSTIDGIITSNGENGGFEYAGGAAGGGLWLITSTLQGSGTIRANGGAYGGNYGGGGGGGRIYIQYTTDSSTISYSAYGGNGYKDGGAGTIRTNNKLTLSNNNNNLPAITLINGGNFTNITISAGSNVNFTATTTIREKLTISNGNYNVSLSKNALLKTGLLLLNDTFFDYGTRLNITKNFTIGSTGTFTQVNTNNVLVNDTTTIYGTYTHKDATSSSTIKGHVKLITTNFNLKSGGFVNVDYKGYLGTTTANGEGKGGGIKATTCGFGGGGGGYGAAGGNGDQGAGGSAYGNSTNVTSMGSAGGGNSCNSDKGGDGGGYVKINVSSTSTIDGIITSNGENGGFEYAGGAAGGGLWLITSTLQGSGTIRANGGAYGGNYGGGGGGGRIYIQYTTDSSTISYSAYGGNGYKDGGAGTIRTNNKLTLSNNNNNLPAITLINGGNFTNITISAGSNVNFTATTTIREKLTISNGNYNVSLSKNALLKTGLLLLNDTFFDYGTRLNITKNFTIGSTGTFTQVNTNNVLVNDTTTIYGTYTHKDATSSSTIKGHVKLITTNFNLKSGGFVNVDYKGYLGTTTANGEGKGGGIKATTCGFGGGGGGYGAAGGNGDQGAGGSAYGNSTNVTSMGSAGGGNSCNSDKGGDGGGYVKINVSSTSTIDGIITSNGENGGFEYAGGAAGGGLWLITSTLQGSGTIRANGGAYGGNYGGGGGGGRIYIQYTTDSSTISYSAYGGNGYKDGGAGTIRTNNKLTLSNNNNNLPAITLINGGNFTNITISAGSNVNFTATTTIREKLTISNGNYNVSLSKNALLKTGLLLLNDTFFDYGTRLNITKNFTIGSTGTFTQVNTNNVLVNDTTTIYGTYTHKDATSSSTIKGHVKLITTNFNLKSGGFVNVDYKGYLGTTTANGEGKGGGIKATTCGFGGGGGGYGAAGGNGDQGAGGSAYGNSTNVTSMGSAGGGNSCNSDKGGDGGGYVKINVSSTSTIDGIITSNGENGGFEYAGGAAGGGLWLITSTLQGSGTIRANGGAYGGNYGGGGGGGRIYIQYTTDSSTISYSAYGGNGYKDGGAGTIRTNNKLTLSNNNNNLPAITLINGGNFTNITISAGSNVNFTATTTIREKLTISNGNYNVSLSKNALLKTGLLLLNDTFFDYGTRLNITKNFTIGSTGTFTQVNTNNVLVNDTTTIYGTYTHKDATSSSTIKGHVKLITTNFNLKSGGFVNVDYKGYLGTTTANGEGKGGGIKATTCGFGGGGGGYGAAGGNGDQGAGGSAYGNSTNVTSMGSAGGGNSCNSDKGGDGGGYVKINVSSTSTIDGIITSNGENGGFEYAGGAAGGGLWLITSTLQGSGTIRANGGAYGGNYGGGGGGGRIYIQYTTDSSTISYSAYGGNGYKDGGAGTIRTNNKLTLSNNNNNLPAITLINGGNFTNITISAGSNVNFTATTTIREKLTISNGNYNVSLSKNALLKTGLLLLNDTFFDYGTRLNITKNFTIGSTGTFTQVNTNNVLVNDTTTIYGTYTHKDATSSSTIKGHVKLITTNFNLKSGGFVNVDYKGYLGTTTANGEGKGGGIKATTCGFGGGGGGYGAAGGNGDQGAGGSAYGNSTNVTSMGSAGGGNSCN